MKRTISGLATLGVAAGLALGIPSAAEAHTGNLHAQVTCVNGTQHVAYTLTLSNVPTGVTGSSRWDIGTTTFTGTPTSNAGLNRGPVSSTGNQTITLGSEDYAGTYSGAGNWVYAYTTFSNGVKIGSDGRIDDFPGNCLATVPVAVAPTQVDECNGPGVTSNVHWSSLPPSTADYTVTGTATTDLTFTLKPGRKWSDGTTGPKHFPLGADSGAVCPEVKPPPVVLPPTFAPPPPPLAPKHARTTVHVVDKCNCYRDKVTMSGGPNVSIKASHPSNTVWVFRVTGKVRDGVQYLLPSRVGGHAGWAASQVYTVKTTNEPCPCRVHHTCHAQYPHFTPPPNACLGRNGC